jgi:hypothetical protein
LALDALAFASDLREPREDMIAEMMGSGLVMAGHYLAVGYRQGYEDLHDLWPL